MVRVDLFRLVKSTGMEGAALIASRPIPGQPPPNSALALAPAPHAPVHPCKLPRTFQAGHESKVTGEFAIGSSVPVRTSIRSTDPRPATARKEG